MDRSTLEQSLGEAKIKMQEAASGGNDEQLRAAYLTWSGAKGALDRYDASIMAKAATAATRDKAKELLSTIHTPAEIPSIHEAAQELGVKGYAISFEDGAYTIEPLFTSPR